jgi:type I restriction enzyme S subunit
MNLPRNARWIEDANNWVAREDLAEIGGRPLPPGTVVFAKIGEAIRQNRLRQLVRETLIDNNMMGAVPKPGRVDPGFLLYALARFSFADIAQGSALPYLTATSLAALPLMVPPLEEQRAIASVLGALDDKIELNRRMSATLEAMARAIFQDWFVAFGPTRAKMEGRPPYLAPDLWSLFPDSLDAEGRPEGWVSATLGEVAVSEARGCSPDEITSGTPYIALEHMPRRQIALGEWATADNVESGKLRFHRGEFLFGKLRPYFHKVGIAPVDGVCTTDAVVIRPTEHALSAFVLMTISSAEFVDFTDRGSTGTKMPRTSWSQMQRYPLTMPKSRVAEAFEALAGPLLNKIIENVHEARTLAATRDLLLPRLMSGELRVKDAERFLERVV